MPTKPSTKSKAKASPKTDVKPQTGEVEPGREKGSTTTAISIPKTTWKLLRAVAFHRAQESGGRASVSKVIAEIIERHRPEFEEETRRV